MTLSLTEIAEVSDKVVEARVNSAGDPSAMIVFSVCIVTVGNTAALSSLGAEPVLASWRKSTIALTAVFATDIRGAGSGR